MAYARSKWFGLTHIVLLAALACASRDAAAQRRPADISVIVPGRADSVLTAVVALANGRGYRVESVNSQERVAYLLSPDPVTVIVSVAQRRDSTRVRVRAFGAEWPVMQAAAGRLADAVRAANPARRRPN
jgi:hypothetical protein